MLVTIRPKWEQGLTDGGNLFHYYRLTADDRILFGGYDAIYRWRRDRVCRYASQVPSASSQGCSRPS